MSLDLSENSLEGEIPSFILECKQLQFLNLSFNNFRGGIPKEIGNLTKLKTLSIGDNKLEGNYRLILLVSFQSMNKRI